MKKHVIKWGMPIQTNPPSHAEIQEILQVINHNASSKRVFELYVTEAMLKWLQENVENICVILIHNAAFDCIMLPTKTSRPTTLTNCFIAIGIDEETTKRHVSYI